MIMKEFKRANENEREDPDNAISDDLRAPNFTLFHFMPLPHCPLVKILWNSLNENYHNYIQIIILQVTYCG